MEKYLSIEIQNLRKKISDAINESGLPNCITKMILTEITIEATNLAEQELINDTKAAQEKEK